MALIRLEEAHRRLLDGVKPLPAIEVPLIEALGRVLAADIMARHSQPPADVSSMDGYAVHAADLPEPGFCLPLAGESAAGRPFEGSLPRGSCLRIFTGAALPAGADAVVMQEDTERQGEAVLFHTAAQAGRFIRPKGLDFTAGAVGLRAGQRLSGRDIALAAAMNYARLPVHRAPRVAVFMTGDELVAPGGTLGPGQIVSSNGVALAALIRAEGGELIDLGIVPDTLEATQAAIRAAREAQADVLVTSGGVSVGEYDFVKPALAAEGCELTTWKIAIRPGKPFMHGHLGAMQVVGLPGNPVSSYVTSLLLLVPLLRCLAGRADVDPAREWAISGVDLKANDERADFLRCTLSHNDDGHVIATPHRAQDSSLMSLLAKSEALLLRPVDAPALKAGDLVEIIRLPV